MKKVTIVWSVIVLLIFSALTILCLNIKNNNIGGVLEKAFITKTKEYMAAYPIFLPTEDKEVTVALNDIIKAGYDPELGKDCEGYIKIKANGTKFNYTAFVKCDKYTTKGYDE